MDEMTRRWPRWSPLVTWPRRGGIAPPALNGGDELARDGAADDLVLELEAGSPRLRLHLQVDDAELAAATGLADEAAFRLRRLDDRLPLGGPPPAHVGAH